MYPPPPPLENALVIVIYVAKHFKNDENVLGSKVIKEIQRNVIAVHDHGHYNLKKIYTTVICSL